MSEKYLQELMSILFYTSKQKNVRYQFDQSKEVDLVFGFLNDILSNSVDEQLIKLSRISGEAFEIFKLLVANLKTYKGNIDDIIIYYYKFLKELTKIIEDHYQKKCEEQN